MWLPTNAAFVSIWLRLAIGPRSRGNKAVIASVVSECAEVLYGSQRPLIRENRDVFLLHGASAAPGEMPYHPILEVVHIEIDHGGRVQGQRLADDESADDGDAERSANLGTNSSAERQRNRAQHGGRGGHHDGTEADQRRFVNRFLRGLAGTFYLKREVNHHDGVLLHDANQQNDANQRDHVELHVEEQKRQ